ncbi:MAG: hypothetical protein JW937_01570 [Candidatus Omnitrophica bacterium]|nr:hypothetical protein [Candidatus Omnitrophota bacterium]
MSRISLCLAMSLAFALTPALARSSGFGEDLAIVASLDTGIREVWDDWARREGIQQVAGRAGQSLEALSRILRNEEPSLRLELLVLLAARDSLQSGKLPVPESWLLELRDPVHQITRFDRLIAALSRPGVRNLLGAGSAELMEFLQRFQQAQRQPEEAYRDYAAMRNAAISLWQQGVRELDVAAMGQKGKLGTQRLREIIEEMSERRYIPRGILDSSGDVFVVEDMETQERYVLVALDPKRTGDSRLIRSVQDELQHPNIVDVISVDSSNRYYILPYVEGMSLATALSEKRLDRVQTLVALRRVVSVARAIWKHSPGFWAFDPSEIILQAEGDGSGLMFVGIRPQALTSLAPPFQTPAEVLVERMIAWAGEVDPGLAQQLSRRAKHITQFEAELDRLAPPQLRVAETLSGQKESSEETPVDWYGRISLQQIDRFQPKSPSDSYEFSVSISLESMNAEEVMVSDVQRDRVLRYLQSHLCFRASPTSTFPDGKRPTIHLYPHSIDVDSMDPRVFEIKFGFPAVPSEGESPLLLPPGATTWVLEFGWVGEVTATQEPTWFPLPISKEQHWVPLLVFEKDSAEVVPNAYPTRVTALSLHERLALQSQMSVQRLLESITRTGGVQSSPVANLGWDQPRDSALVLKALVHELTDLPPDREDARNEIEWKIFSYLNFIDRTHAIIKRDPQQYPHGLGTSRYYLEAGSDHEIGEPLSLDAGQPQHDGLALRVVALSDFALELANHGRWDEARAVYETIQKDLRFLYTSQPDSLWPSRNLQAPWEAGSFDVWEELGGLHFYTRMVQRRALLTAAKVEDVLGISNQGNVDLRALASLIEQELGKHVWTLGDLLEEAEISSEERELIEKLVGYLGKDRSALETPIVVASLDYYGKVLRVFDSANLGALIHTLEESEVQWGLQNPALMNTVAALEFAFSDAFPVNQRWAAYRPTGMGIGRYVGDCYDGYGLSRGNPWTISTLWMERYFTRLALEWMQQGNPELSADRRLFYRHFFEIDPKNRRLKKQQPQQLITRAQEISEGYLDWVLSHLPQDGSVTSQVDAETGWPRGTRNLAWAHRALVRSYVDRERLAARMGRAPEELYRLYSWVKEMSVAGQLPVAFLDADQFFGDGPAEGLESLKSCLAEMQRAVPTLCILSSRPIEQVERLLLRASDGEALPIPYLIVGAQPNRSGSAELYLFNQESGGYLRYSQSLGNWQEAVKTLSEVLDLPIHQQAYIGKVSGPVRWMRRRKAGTAIESLGWGVVIPLVDEGAQYESPSQRSAANPIVYSGQSGVLGSVRAVRVFEEAIQALRVSDPDRQWRSISAAHVKVPSPQAVQEGLAALLVRIGPNQVGHFTRLKAYPGQPLTVVSSEPGMLYVGLGPDQEPWREIGCWPLQPQLPPLHGYQAEIRGASALTVSWHVPGSDQVWWEPQDILIERQEVNAPEQLRRILDRRSKTSLIVLASEGMTKKVAGLTPLDRILGASGLLGTNGHVVFAGLDKGQEHPDSDALRALHQLEVNFLEAQADRREDLLRAIALARERGAEHLLVLDSRWIPDISALGWMTHILDGRTVTMAWSVDGQQVPVAWSLSVEDALEDPNRLTDILRGDVGQWHPYYSSVSPLGNWNNPSHRSMLEISYPKALGRYGAHTQGLYPMDLAWLIFDAHGLPQPPTVLRASPRSLVVATPEGDRILKIFTPLHDGFNRFMREKEHGLHNPFSQTLLWFDPHLMAVMFDAQIGQAHQTMAAQLDTVRDMESLRAIMKGAARGLALYHQEAFSEAGYMTEEGPSLQIWGHVPYRDFPTVSGPQIETIFDQHHGLMRNYMQQLPRDWANISDSHLQAWRSVVESQRLTAVVDDPSPWNTFMDENHGVVQMIDAEWIQSAPAAMDLANYVINLLEAGYQMPFLMEHYEEAVEVFLREYLYRIDDNAALEAIPFFIGSRLLGNAWYELTVNGNPAKARWAAQMAEFFLKSGPGSGWTHIPTREVEITYRPDDGWGGHHVGVVAPFTHEHYRPMDFDEERGVYKTRLKIPYGPHEYHFVVNGQAISDPQARRQLARGGIGRRGILNVQPGAEKDPEGVFRDPSLRLFEEYLRSVFERGEVPVVFFDVDHTLSQEYRGPLRQSTLESLGQVGALAGLNTGADFLHAGQRVLRPLSGMDSEVRLPFLVLGKEQAEGISFLVYAWEEKLKGYVLLFESADKGTAMDELADFLGWPRSSMVFVGDFPQTQEGGLPIDDSVLQSEVGMIVSVGEGRSVDTLRVRSESSATLIAPEELDEPWVGPTRSGELMQTFAGLLAEYPQEVQKAQAHIQKRIQEHCKSQPSLERARQVVVNRKNLGEVIQLEAEQILVIRSQSPGAIHAGVETDNGWENVQEIPLVRQPDGTYAERILDPRINIFQIMQWTDRPSGKWGWEEQVCRISRVPPTAGSPIPAPGGTAYLAELLSQSL